MPIAIDGYNLMHAAGLMKQRFGPQGFEKARRAFIGILAASLGDEAVRTTVVFDAKSPSGTDAHINASQGPGGIRVVFAPGPDGADAHLEELIRSESAPKKLLVVSSDSRIRQAAQRRGCATCDSDAYWDKLLHRRTRPRAGKPARSSDKPAGSADAAFWLNEFAGIVRDDELRELRGLFDFDFDADEDPDDPA